MKFGYLNKQINMLLDGELKGEEESKLLEHIKQCKKCRDEYNHLLFLKKLLSKKEKAEPSPYFISKVLNHLKTKDSSITLIDLIARRAWSLIAVFSLLIFLTLGMFIYSDFQYTAEMSFIESEEYQLIAENGITNLELADTEVSYDDIWQSIIEE